MKAFFKESDKLIINSMSYDEALVGKQFLAALEGKVVKVEQRNDINDDFDGLVISIVEPTPEPETTETEPTQETVTEEQGETG
jgi:hypothetical protein